MQDYYAQCPCEVGLKCKGTQEDMYWFCRAWIKQYVQFIVEIMLIGCLKVGWIKFKQMFKVGVWLDVNCV